jgi:glycosyltransferase involved in cell wall biosynthesis
MMPRVSVVIPTYNYGRYLGEAVSSVLGQTFPDFECIVVDDGSNDETGRVLASFTDPRMVIDRTPRLGVSGARNRGVDLSRGDLIAFLDADDRWRPGKLERQVAILDKEPDVDMVFTNFLRFTAEEGFLPDQFSYVPELGEVPRRATAGGGLVIEGNPFDFLIGAREAAAWVPTVAVRRTAAEGIRFPPGVRVGEDLHYLLHVAWKCRALAYLPDPQVEVRRHGNNAYEARDIPAHVVRVLRMMEGEASFAGRSSFRRRLGRELAALGSRLASQGEFTRAVEALAGSLRYRESRLAGFKACLGFPPRWLKGVLGTER